MKLLYFLGHIRAYFLCRNAADAKLYTIDDFKHF